MTREEMARLCDAQGVPRDVILVEGVMRFRCLDVSQLPGSLRPEFDGRGLLVSEAAVDVETLEIAAPKKGKKAR